MSPALLDDLADQVEQGAAQVMAVQEVLALARDGGAVPASAVRLLLAPAMDALQQAVALLDSVRERQAAKG